MTEHKDQELNDTLDKGSSISGLYQKSKADDGPSEFLDKRILKAAGDAVKTENNKASGPFSGHWFVPASTAAVLVLSIGLITLMQDETGNDMLSLDEGLVERSPVMTEESAIILEQETTPILSNKFAERKLKKERFKADSDQSRIMVPATLGSIAENVQRQQIHIAPEPLLSKNRDETRSIVEHDDMPRSNAVMSTMPIPAELMKNIMLQDQEFSGKHALMPDVSTDFSAKPLAPAKQLIEAPVSAIPYATPPEQWLVVIKYLYQEGKSEEADKMLDEFIQLYPDYPTNMTLE